MAVTKVIAGVFLLISKIILSVSASKVYDNLISSLLVADSSILNEEHRERDRGQDIITFQGYILQTLSADREKVDTELFVKFLHIFLVRHVFYSVLVFRKCTETQFLSTNSLLLILRKRQIQVFMLSIPKFKFCQNNVKIV